MRPSNKQQIAQIDRRVEAIRASTTQTKVQPGWIRFMREALGMTMRSLAERTNVAIPTIQQAERNEASGAISVKRLRQLAEAMDCELVYAFVPKTPIQKALESAARVKAERLLKIANTHMSLENQRVKKSFDKRINVLASALLKKGDIW